MNNIIKKIMAVAMTAAMVSSFTVSASAEDEKNTWGYNSTSITQTGDYEKMTSARGINTPTELFNLSNGDYSGCFSSIYNRRYTNTSKIFLTNTTKINIDYSLLADINFSNPRNLTITLYRTAKNSTSWTKVTSFNHPFYPSQSDPYKRFNGTYTFENLSSNYYYYIKFTNSSSSSTTNEEAYSIAGDIVITD